MDDKQFILDFLKSCQYAVISTVNSDGSPESAVVGFGLTEDLELVLGTNGKSRKAINITANPRVSYVIGWDERKTVQLEGEARLLTDEEAGDYKEVYFAKNPFARKYESAPDQCYYAVTPRWIRYTDISVHPWETKEIEV